MGPISAPTQGKFDESTLRTQLAKDNLFLSNSGILLLTSLYNGTTSSNRCRLKFTDEQNAEKNAQQMVAWLQKNGSNYSMKVEGAYTKVGDEYHIYVQMDKAIWDARNAAAAKARPQGTATTYSSNVQTSQFLPPQITTAQPPPASSRWKGYRGTIASKSPSAPSLKEGETPASPQLMDYPTEESLNLQEIPNAHSAHYVYSPSSSAEVEYYEHYKRVPSVEEACTRHAAVSLVEFAKQTGFIDSSFDTSNSSADSLISKLNEISNPAFWQLVNGMKISGSSSMEVFVSPSSSKAEIAAYKKAFANNLSVALDRYQAGIHGITTVLNKCGFEYVAGPDGAYTFKNTDGTKGNAEITLAGKGISVGGMEISLEDAQAYSSDKKTKASLEKRAIDSSGQMLNTFITALRRQPDGEAAFATLGGIVSQTDSGYSISDASKFNAWLSRGKGSKVAADKNADDAQKQFRDENNPNDPKVRALYTMRGVGHEYNTEMSLSLSLSKFAMRDGVLQPIAAGEKLKKGEKVYVLLDTRLLTGNSSVVDSTSKIVASYIEHTPQLSSLTSISSTDVQNPKDAHIETLDGKRYLVFDVKQEGSVFVVSAFAKSPLGMETSVAQVNVSTVPGKEASKQGQPVAQPKRIPMPRSPYLPPQEGKALSPTIQKTIETIGPATPPSVDNASQILEFFGDNARSRADEFMRAYIAGDAAKILEILNSMGAGGGSQPSSPQPNAVARPGGETIGTRPQPLPVSQTANIPGREIISTRPQPLPVSQTANIPGRATIGTGKTPPVNDARPAYPIPMPGPNPSPPLSQTVSRPGVGVGQRRPGDIDDRPTPAYPGPITRNNSNLSSSAVANPNHRGDLRSTGPIDAEKIKDGTTPVVPGPITPGRQWIDSLPAAWFDPDQYAPGKSFQDVLDLLNRASQPGYTGNFQQEFIALFGEHSMMRAALEYTPGKKGEKVIDILNETTVTQIREQIGSGGVSVIYFPGEFDVTKLKPGQIVSVGINYAYNAGTRTFTFLSGDKYKEKLGYGTIGGTLVLKGPAEILFNLGTTGMTNPSRGIVSAGASRSIKLSENVAMALGGSVSFQAEKLEDFKYMQPKDLQGALHLNFYYRPSDNVSLGLGASRTSPLISNPALGAIFLNPSVEYRAAAYTFGVRGNVPLSGGTKGAGISANISTPLIPLGENIGHAVVSLFGGYSDMTKTFPQARQVPSENPALPTQF